MKAVRVFLLILTTVLLNFNYSFGQTEAVKNDQKSANTAVLASKNDNEGETYRIGFQDQIEVRVFNHAELTLKYGINPDGSIDLIRSTKPISAVCKTERELAKEIEKEYFTFLKKPQVNVYVVEKKSQSYGVMGAVEKSGRYYGVSRIRLLELLSMAGGPNKEAGSRLIVARAGSSSACSESREAATSPEEFVLMNFKVKDVLEAKQNLWMQPGDIVSVMDSDLIYVYGNVNKVGSVKMEEPITLTQAIVSAEGLKPTAKSKIRILRQKKDSLDREELLFDLKDIEKRKAQDPFLEPNDIVAVSEDSTKAVLKGVTDVFKNGLPSLFYRIP